MALKFAVNTIFKARDEQSRQFNKMGKNAKKFGETSSKAFKKASKSATGFGAITKGILSAGAISKGLGLLKTGLTAATTAFIGFDDSITAASAKFKGLDLTTKEGQKTLAALRKEARKVGAETKFSALEAAGGLDFYATAGFNAAQAMAVLKPTAKLATIANLDLARTSDIASDSIGAFGLMTKDSVQLQKNFTRVSDVMAKTMTSTNTNMEDMFEAIKKGAPTFTATGQSIETFNTLMGTLANAGVKGSEAGTQLRNVMLRLSKPTKEAQESLDALGIKTEDSKGNFRDIVDVLADFEKGLKGMGNKQKAAALKTIFGSRSVTGLNLLLQEGTGNLRKFRKTLDESAGATDKMATIMDKSLGNRLASLKSAAIEAGFSLLSAFKGQGVGAIEALTGAIRNFDMKPIIDGIKLVISKGKMMFETMEKAGVIDLLADSFKTLGSIIKLMWSIAEPIFKLMWKILSPWVKVLGIVVRGLGLIAESLVVEDPTAASANRRSALDLLNQDQGAATAEDRGRFAQRGFQNQAARVAPNQQQFQSQTLTAQQQFFKGQLDITGAPEGSKFAAKKGGDAVDVKLLGPTPAFSG